MDSEAEVEPEQISNSRPSISAILVLLLAFSVVAACTDSAPPQLSSEADSAPRASTVTVSELRPQVLATAPHDRSAFTQGLEVSGSVLLEGSGIQGRSQLRELDPSTGAVRRAVDLPRSQFGEGITVDSSTVWQLTRTDRVAVARDRASLAPVRVVPLDREGWGICRDGDRLVTSDGTDTLIFRDRVTFASIGSIQVRAADTAVDRLNEIECTPDGVWANVWPTDRLVRIDPQAGEVTASVDAAELLPPDQRAGTDVLNGIAAIPGTDEYWITGKLWPTMSRLRFVPH